MCTVPINSVNKTIKLVNMNKLYYYNKRHRLNHARS